MNGMSWSKKWVHSPRNAHGELDEACAVSWSSRDPPGWLREHLDTRTVICENLYNLPQQSESHITNSDKLTASNTLHSTMVLEFSVQSSFRRTVRKLAVRRPAKMMYRCRWCKHFAANLYGFKHVSTYMVSTHTRDHVGMPRIAKKCVSTFGLSPWSTTNNTCCLLLVMLVDPAITFHRWSQLESIAGFDSPNHLYVNYAFRARPTFPRFMCRKKLSSISRWLRGNPRPIMPAFLLE